MIVREQSSPRAQLVHRDGTRQYFCAIGDLLAYLPVPSPHGRVEAVFVEAMDAKVAEPLAFDPSPRPWIAAADGHYVVGIERHVMGVPVLVYGASGDAEAVARRVGGRVVDWTTLRGEQPSP